ncbi:MAG: diaminopimelate epimerase [Gemmatimonadota bacterium]|nr:diaminopimelate epimerase [Gemmatimonadota bacterium]
MRLQFTKMHGLGNDFVVFDAINQDVCLSREQLCWVADRRLGVGCDQVLVVRPASDPEADFDYQVYNSNGEEVEQCGNGARCIGKFLRHNDLTHKNSISVKTVSGIYHIHLREDDLVTVDMGTPVFEPEKIPFTAAQISSSYMLEVGKQQVEIGAVSMGNPHAVMQVDNIEHAPVSTLGPKIEVHPMFPRKVNVGFMQILDSQHIALRVFERDVGETSACGTGACAAVVVGQSQNRLGTKVSVRLPGGRLLIECDHPDQPVLMTGPATLSFEGSLML